MQHYCYTYFTYNIFFLKLLILLLLLYNQLSHSCYIIIIIIFSPLVLDSISWEIIWKNYNTLGASRLVQKLCWKVSKWVVETNRIEALKRNKKTLTKKRSFTRVIKNEGESLTQRTKKSEPTWFMGPKIYGTKGLKSKRKNVNWKKFRRTCLLSSWLLLQLLSQRKRMWRSDMRLQRCGWRSRPRWHNVLLSMVWVWDLMVPWLTEIRLWKVNARSGHSQSNGAVIDLCFVCTRAHESHDCRLSLTEVPQMHRYGWQSSEPAGGPQQLSKLRCSGGVRMLILDILLLLILII